MYYKGDFELALVFYHRGHKLRPELQEFRLGIQKAQEAIENSVGSEYSLHVVGGGWLLNVPATCQCISETDLLRQFYVLPH